VIIIKAPFIWFKFSNSPKIINAKVKMEKIGPQLGGKVAKSVVEMEI